MSDQPFSKWQAIFNLDQIKERNKPKLAKEKLPSAPFFLFDLDKVTGNGERAARDFLAETFFSDFDKHRKSQQSEAGSKALEKHDVKKRLRSLLKE